MSKSSIVTLGKYKNVPVHHQNVSIRNEDVMTKLKALQLSHAKLVNKRGVAHTGDTVIIDFKGYVDGKRFEGGQATNYSLELGSHAFIGNFEDQLVGHKAGDKVTVKVTFPKDYQAKVFRNKVATFNVKINAIKKEKVPKLNDTFAKKVNKHVSNLSDLKSNIKKQLKDQRKQQARTHLQNEVIKAVVNNAKVGTIPKK